MKDLPSLPHALSITSLTLSLYVDPSAIREGSVKSLAIGQSGDPSKQGPTSILAIKEMGDLPPVPPLNFKLKGMKNRNSTSLLVNGRPWNQDENYSWTNEHQKLQITMPCQVQEEPQDVKLRGSRASVTNADTVKITKNSSSSTPMRRFSGANDLFRAPMRRRSKQPGVKPMKGKRASVHTRFIESFDAPLPDALALSLVSPSPDLKIEMKDFFDDKTSRVRPKSGLRKQLPNLKHKATGPDHSKTGQGLSQGSSSLISKEARASRRSSVTSVRSFDGETRSKGVRSRFVRKIRGWVLKGEERINAWRAKRRARRAESLHSKST